MTPADTLRAAVEALEGMLNPIPSPPPDVPGHMWYVDQLKGRRDAADYALSLLRSAIEQGEPKLPVLNALEVLERMDYRPGDSAVVENFLAVLWARGMWVIDNPLASIPPNTPAPSDDEIRKVWNRTQDPIATVRAFVPSGVMASDGSKPE